MIVRKIYNEKKEVIYHGIDHDKNVIVLCQLLWNKYVLQDVNIVKVEKWFGEKGAIKFYFSNGLAEEFTDLPLTMDHLYMGVN